jgi:predicted GNAT family acetyltransferase
MPLEPTLNGVFLKFLMRDIISNYFAILDFELYKEKTKFWVALEGDTNVVGYLLEHDGKIVYLRGNVECITELLKMTSLIKPEFNVEKTHIQTIKRFYEPTNPVGTSRGKINEISAMEVDKKRFKPIAKCIPQKLGMEEFDALERLYAKFYEEITLGPITREQIRRTLDRCTKYGFTYGIYDEHNLVSFASGSSILKDVAHMAPVYTLPKFRRRGYATSACSALAGELLNNNERTMLFVSESNIPALKVYKKIGFTKTGHTFLTFFAHRKSSAALTPPKVPAGPKN